MMLRKYERNKEVQKYFELYHSEEDVEQKIEIAMVTASKFLLNLPEFGIELLDDAFEIAKKNELSTHIIRIIFKKI